MRTATYDEARQWLKDKPRRMKANPKSFYTHSVAHYENEGCKHNGCLPVDATVETHDGVTTDGHGKLLGGQGSEPRNDEPFHGCRLCAECGLPIMPNAPSKQFNLKGKEICYTCFEKPTPPPAPAPVPHWICEKCGKLEPSQVENGDVCRVCGGAVMWFEPVADAPKGTPVERWPRLTETERIALRTALARLGPTGAHELEELVERLCALLGEKEKQVKIEDSFRKQWMEDALEQRTRAESAEAVLDKRCADVKRLEADLAAARERIRKWEDDYTVLSDECHAARGREAKLREALRRIETHRPGSDESIIARAALAETTEKE